MNNLSKFGRHLAFPLPPSVALRFISAEEDPGHDTITVSRTRFLKQIEALSVPILIPVAETNMLKTDAAPLDGRKIDGRARITPGSRLRRQVRPP